jgi:hypothetical protein
MTSSREGLFDSIRSFRHGKALALEKILRMTRSGVWLTILIASVCCPAFAQHGVEEFRSNGTFTVPAGVNTMRVDAYGAGGGGGGGDSTFVGGSGGGGAYNAGVIPVSPGAVLTVVVGSGGKGGPGGDPGGAGSAGGSSKIANSSKVILFSANGGKGGQGDSGSANGAPGAGGAAGTFGTIRHAGKNADSFGNPGSGYVPVGFTPNTIDGVEIGFGCGGFGGSGTPGNGPSGQPGYILISW